MMLCNDEIKLENTVLVRKVKIKLISNGILTIGDLEKLSLSGLLNLDNICLSDIIHIKAVLNGDYNIHIEDEEYLDYSDMFDEESQRIIKLCDLAISQRNYFRKLSKIRKSNERLSSIYFMKQKNLTLVISELINKLFCLRIERDSKTI